MVRLLALLAAVIFADVTAPRSPGPSVSPLQVTAELASGELRAGQPAMFRVHIRNVGSVNQKIGTLRDGDFRLKTDKGAQQWTRSVAIDWRCRPARILKPNEVDTLVYLVDLDGLTLSGSGSLTLDLHFAYLDGTCVAQPLTWSGPVEVAAAR